ncbi:Crp/Fnr family transcriptional regulator [Methylobacterium sp. CM6247]
MPFGTRPLNPLIHKIESFVRLSDAERTLLQEISEAGRRIEQRTMLVEEGAEALGAFLIMEGLAYCYKQRKNGRRQITALLIPGDLGNLDAPLRSKMDRSIGTCSICRVVWLSPETIQRLQQHSNIARGLRLSTLVDRATLHEWLLNVGSRSSLERLAHLFCELYLRYQTVGWAHGQSYDLPLKQADLADLAGMSCVHINRLLQELRRRRLIELKKGRLSILEWKKLKALAEFDDHYLHLSKGRNSSASGDLPLRMSGAEPGDRCAFESDDLMSVQLKRLERHFHSLPPKSSDALM